MRFPMIDYSNEQIIAACANVKQNRAGTYDCYPNELFQIGKNCCFGTYNTLCEECFVKINIAKGLLNPHFWDR